MLRYGSHIISLALAAIGFTSIVAAAPPDSKEGLELFEKEIRPVLVAKCYQCHSSSTAKPKGGLLLDTREGIRTGGESGASVVPGETKQSLLLEAIRHEGLEMPPKEKLPEKVIASFERWIELGAPDPREKAGPIKREIDIAAGKQHWAYQAPKIVAPQPVAGSNWAKTEIDRYVLAKLAENKLTPVGDADNLTLLRRTTFDLTGLPPSLAEIEAFTNDKSDKAFEKVVDRLLASPQFGERWGRHWLDVVRYAESTGKERNVPFNYAWRYRDWVIDAINADKPYDQFIREQVAGDLLPAKSPGERNALLTATGFLTLGPKGLNDKNAEQYTMDVVDEQIDVVSRSILGTTVSCARCHDHKFDPIPQADYYALAGIFKSTTIHPGVTRGTQAPTDKALLVMQTDVTGDTKMSPEKRAQIARLTGEIADLETQRDKLAQANAKLVKANKAAQKAAMAAGKKKKQAIAEAEKAATKQPQAAKLAERKAVLDEKIARLEADLKAIGYEPPQGDLVMAAEDAKQVVDCRICIRGEVKDLGDMVPRGFVSVLKTDSDPTIAPNSSGRKELAQWLTRRENPLTARVMANRVWAHLTGSGLVNTVDDFGALGAEPSHPELLDYLAVQFMDEGWSLKQLVRMVVLSRTYQLASTHDEANYAIDPANEFNWRMNRRRLDAEAIRDATLLASGELTLERPDGSPVEELKGEIGRGVNLAPLKRLQTCRSVYLPLLRGVIPEMLGVFDVADPNLVVGQRDVTTVPTQALYMMNSPFVQQQAEATAKVLLASDKSNDAARVSQAHLRILGRQPSERERQLALEYLQDLGSNPQVAWATLCQTLYATAEFRYVY